MMANKRLSKLLMTSAACILLAACQTTQAVNQGQDSRDAKIDSALERAAMSAAASGSKNQSLGYLEKIYKRKSTDPVAAMNYARALRNGDYYRRAEMVLQPFALDPEGPSLMKSEYAAVLLADGNYAGAEKYAQKAIDQDAGNFEAYHYLGIALDAQGEHETAETAFRSGLDHWKGDPTTIMNNLALNLASQGFLDEAAEILHKAQAVAPHRMEIERNLRIVTALQQSNGRRAPKPYKKPQAPAPKVEKQAVVEETPEAIEPAASENHDAQSAPLEPVEVEAADEAKPAQRPQPRYNN